MKIFLVLPVNVLLLGFSSSSQWVATEKRTNVIFYNVFRAQSRTAEKYCMSEFKCSSQLRNDLQIQHPFTNNSLTLVFPPLDVWMLEAVKRESAAFSGETRRTAIYAKPPQSTHIPTRVATDAMWPDERRKRKCEINASKRKTGVTHLSLFLKRLLLRWESHSLPLQRGNVDIWITSWRWILLAETVFGGRCSWWGFKRGRRLRRQRRPSHLKQTVCLLESGCHFSRALVYDQWVLCFCRIDLTTPDTPSPRREEIKLLRWISQTSSLHALAGARARFLLHGQVRLCCVWLCSDAIVSSHYRPTLAVRAH